MWSRMILELRYNWKPLAAGVVFGIVSGALAMAWLVAAVGITVLP